MKRDPLKQFVALRKSLESEKARIESRLQEINRAFGTKEAEEAPAPPKRQTGDSVRQRVKQRLQNPMPLQEAIRKVTSATPLTKKEIISAVQKIGYKFTTKNPANSLNRFLYGKKAKFKNRSGKFSPA